MKITLPGSHRGKNAAALPYLSPLSVAECDSLLPVMLEARHLHPIGQNTETLEISEGQNLNPKQGVGVRDA